MKKKIIITTVLAFVFGLATGSSAVTLNYETMAGDGGPGAGIFYTLNFSQTEENKYSATFSVISDSSSGAAWYAGWFTFKFVGGEVAATIGTLEAPSETWNLIPPTTSVYGGTNIGQGGRSGFYAADLYSSTGVLESFPYSQLLQLSQGNEYTFTFDFSTNLPVFTDDIPFQVGYYDGVNGSERVITNRLSQTLAVPEPATLILLGAGFIGVGILGRKRFRTKA